MVLAAALLGPPSARVSAAPPDAAAPVEPAALEVRVEPQTLDSELDRVRVEQRGRTVLERRAVGLEPGERIVVDLAGEASGYRVIVRAFRHGVPVAHEPASFEHDGTIDELLDRAAVAVDDAASRLVAERERVRLGSLPPAPMPPRQAQGDEGRERPLAEPPPRRRFRLRIPGAVAAGLGASMMAGGTILTARGQQPPGDGLLTPQDLLPPGAALLGAGAAFLATGATLLVIDAVRCRRHPVASCLDQRATLRPSP